MEEKKVFPGFYISVMKIKSLIRAFKVRIIIVNIFKFLFIEHCTIIKKCFLSLL